MPFGYNNKVLRVDLSNNSYSVEEPGENFFRRYFGGRSIISHYLLKELKPGINPLGPDNKLIFSLGVVTGAPIGGCGRNSVGAKSPLTGAYGDAEVGGYWGAELKHAGYDVIIIEGKADSPVYLWINDGSVEIRDAGHIWGATTGETQAMIRHELNDKLIRTALIGPAGENLVRYACIMNDLNHAAGRTGLGAVMGSKNLKAIAVRGRHRPEMADPGGIKELNQWLSEHLSSVQHWHDVGTAGGLTRINEAGGLPTRNFQEGFFSEAEKLSGATMRDTILIGRGSCYACPIRCKRKVSVTTPYIVNPSYGGPEYETLAALGSNCCIDDLAAVAKANEECNAYGMDTISTGVAVSFAMECVERGILKTGDVDGLSLHFGNAEAMLQLVAKIAKREGIGNILADGVARASKAIGGGSEEYAFHIKGQEIPMHEPRYKFGLGLGYAISPTGADHSHNIHDNLYSEPGPQLDNIKALGILDPIPIDELSSAKVRLAVYHITWHHFLNSLVMCQFVPFRWDFPQMEKLVRSVTGWNSTTWEFMKVGERCMAMTRIFNIREGFSRDNDFLPKRFFEPFASGPLKGVRIDKQQFQESIGVFYAMMGWDKESGRPSLGKLQELGIEWAAEYL